MTLCGLISETECVCVRVAEHEPPHVCACRGAWWEGDDRLPVPWAIPEIGLPPLMPNEVEAYADTLKPMTFVQALRALAKLATELAQEIPPEATIGDLRQMTIGDLDGRIN